MGAAKKKSTFYIICIPGRQDAEYYSHNGNIYKYERNIYAVAKNVGIDLIS
jgi:hypothetical protein